MVRASTISTAEARNDETTRSTAPVASAGTPHVLLSFDPSLRALREGSGELNNRYGASIKPSVVPPATDCLCSRAVPHCAEGLIGSRPFDRHAHRGALALNLAYAESERGDLRATREAFAETARIGQATHNLLVASIGLLNLGQLEAHQGALRQALV
jgi:hypothetical protein